MVSRNPPPPPPRLTGDDPESDSRSTQKWYSDLHNNLVNETRLGDPARQYVPDTFDPDNLFDPASSSIANAQLTANEAYNRATDLTPVYEAIDLKLSKASNLSDVANAATSLANLGGAPLDGATLINASLTSPTLTGVPIAATAAVDTSTTQLATTAFVTNQASDDNPLINGTAAPGTSKRYSRKDHVHPTDTTRAPLASPNFTGTPQISGANILTDTGAWTAYTPSYSPITGTFTSATASGRYKQIGKTVHFRVKFTITTLGTASTAAVDLTLPVTAQADGFVFIGRENAVTGNFFLARILSGFLRINGTDDSASTYPAGNGYVLDVSGSYEAA